MTICTCINHVDYVIQSPPKLPLCFGDLFRDRANLPWLVDNNKSIIRRVLADHDAGGFSHDLH